ncbi:MAG: hypothetical protein EOP84_20915 [Verrucomicrobiaceae bacterium]|nr:MAG: hypothetical protein EOP84_20915 [Verrucomicrobiaceae bacterium]
MKLRGILLFGLSFSFYSCGAVDNQKYNEHLKVIESVAAPGRNIYSVKSELEKKGYEVSDPYDPTKLGKVLWMNVLYGSTPGFADGVLYAAGLPDTGAPGSIVVKAGNNGVISELER